MKLNSSNSIKIRNWQHYIHFSFIALILCLCIIIPVMNKTTGTPPYWGIILIFGIPVVLYLLFITIIYTGRQSWTNHEIPVQQEQRHIQQETTIQINEEQVVYPYCEDNQLRILNNNITLLQEEEDDLPSMDARSYNPSTMGIPPSSFLAPTNNQSIRSSSLDYTPPPPAYPYPPSYHSDHSLKYTTTTNNNTRQ